MTLWNIHFEKVSRQCELDPPTLVARPRGRHWTLRSATIHCDLQFTHGYDKPSAWQLATTHTCCTCVYALIAMREIVPVTQVRVLVDLH